MRTVQCACGGSITAPSLEVAAPYVYAHNLTSAHRFWRAVTLRKYWGGAFPRRVLS